jgi:hypothetical protein
MDEVSLSEAAASPRFLDAIAIAQKHSSLLLFSITTLDNNSVRLHVRRIGERTEPLKINDNDPSKM